MNSNSSSESETQHRLVSILEQCLADLEQGVAVNDQEILAAHPELADELRPHLENLRLLQRAAVDLRVSPPAPHNAQAQIAGHPVRQIGDFRIVREIGRGGMGIVYEAHQISLNRQVALKMLPFAALLDQRQIARFRNEAQAAAQLHHPHIVPVFAVGQEQGVYYYAMQLVDGQSLEQIVGHHGNSTPGPLARTAAEGAVLNSTRGAHSISTLPVHSLRSGSGAEYFKTAARLAKEAAEALQHAHELGIIHRDIKPSNLLIDKQSKLWITDFGLARVQTDSGMTLTGDVVGTLRYMSPEQASGKKELVDVRTDVYSLGATLYELVTQHTAHPGDDRASLIRRVLDEEPLAPRKLNPAIPVDLETIVLTAMAKSRDDRYPSARALADDLDRFLAGKPTLARQPTVIDRATKWAWRHRSLVAVAACAVVLLSIVSAIGMALLAREQARTSTALQQVAQRAIGANQFSGAEKYFQQAQGAVDQLGVRLSDRLVDIPGTETVRRDVLLDTLGYYRQFLAEAADDPTLQHELALAHFRCASIAAKLGNADNAINEYQESVRLFSSLTGSKSSPPDCYARLAAAKNNLGLLFASRGMVDAARKCYDEAITIGQSLCSRESANPSYVSQLAEAEGNLGMLCDQIGDPSGAERSLRASVRILSTLAHSSPDQPQPHRDLAIAYNNLSFVLRKTDPAAAADAARQAVDILKQLVDRFPADVQFADDLALCWNTLAALEGALGHSHEAIDWQQQAITLQERLTHQAPSVVHHRSDLASSLNNLGVFYSRANRPDDADTAFRRARDILSALADDDRDELAYRSSLAGLMNNQALALSATHRYSESLTLYRDAIEAQQSCLERAQNPLPCARR